MKKNISLPILACLIAAFTVSPLFADIVVVNFEKNNPDPEATYRQTNGITRFANSENQGFKFNHFGIMSTVNDANEGEAKHHEAGYDQLKGYYWGNSPESGQYIGYNDNGANFRNFGTGEYGTDGKEIKESKYDPASIVRADGAVFTFLGGYFTPAHYEVGWVQLVGWTSCVLDDDGCVIFDKSVKQYDIIFEIGLKLDDEPELFNLAKFVDEYYKDAGYDLENIVRLDIISYEDDTRKWASPLDEVTESHQIVMDDLTFGGDITADVNVPEPATIAVFSLGAMGLTFYRRKRSS